MSVVCIGVPMNLLQSLIRDLYFSSYTICVTLYHLGFLRLTIRGTVAFLILRGSFSQPCDVVLLSTESTYKDAQDLSAYVAFHLTLRDAHERFIRKVAARSKDLLNQHLLAIISSFFDFCGNDPYMYSSRKNGMTGI